MVRISSPVSGNRGVVWAPSPVAKRRAGKAAAAAGEGALVCRSRHLQEAGELVDKEDSVYHPFS